MWQTDRQTDGRTENTVHRAAWSQLKTLKIPLWGPYDARTGIARIPVGVQGWGQFRNWNWNWHQFQFQELELQRNWIKGIGIGIDKEELKELIQFPFLIVNSFWFFAMFLAESLNQFDLKPFWIQLTRISLDRYIILYDNLSIKWILHCSYWLHFFHQIWPRNLVVNQRL